MVVATTATLVVPLFWRAHNGAGASGTSAITPTRRRWFAFLTAAAVPVIALGFYAWSGRPELAVAPPAPDDDVATMRARAAMRGGGETGGDLDAAIEKLRLRLASNPEDTAGWRLLAQSYEFEGRTAEAAEANKHADGGMAPPVVAPARQPDADSTRLAQGAEQHRRAREYPQAIAAYAELARHGSMSADQWADYADALGGARGKLDDDAAACIDNALRIDPDHAKALWLRASWQTQREDYAAALATWQRLAAVLPADSPDARIIAANLAEARAKLPAGARPAPATARVVMRGSVRLDPRWKDHVATGTVLFVFARAADERGPPLAVLRTTAGSWPLAFELDDSNAMMPGRKLSDFTRVILEARLSRSGNALAQPGDLRAVSAVLNPRAAQPLLLTIAEEVGAAPTNKGS
jgi:cytochrome c-type biogenesis protein CcmH